MAQNLPCFYATPQGQRSLSSWDPWTIVMFVIIWILIVKHIWGQFLGFKDMKVVACVCRQLDAIREFANAYIFFEFGCHCRPTASFFAMPWTKDPHSPMWKRDGCQNWNSIALLQPLFSLVSSRVILNAESPNRSSLYVENAELFGIFSLMSINYMESFTTVVT